MTTLRNPLTLMAVVALLLAGACKETKEVAKDYVEAADETGEIVAKKTESEREKAVKVGATVAKASREVKETVSEAAKDVAAIVHDEVGMAKRAAEKLERAGDVRREAGEERAAAAAGAEAKRKTAKRAAAENSPQGKQ